MKKYIILFLILIGCKPLFYNHHISHYEKTGCEVGNNSYKIIKIDSVSDVYIIYARKADSVFKIASYKEVLNCNNQIKSGHCYALSLFSVFHDNGQRVKFSEVRYHGVTIKLERDSIVRDLFVTQSLRGICYAPN